MLLLNDSFSFAFGNLFSMIFFIDFFVLVVMAFAFCTLHEEQSYEPSWLCDCDFEGSPSPLNEVSDLGMKGS